MVVAVMVAGAAFIFCWIWLPLRRLITLLQRKQEPDKL